jgi:hypothetical protein
VPTTFGQAASLTASASPIISFAFSYLRCKSEKAFSVLRRSSSSWLRSASSVCVETKEVQNDRKGCSRAVRCSYRVVLGAHTLSLSAALPLFCASTIFFMAEPYSSTTCLCIEESQGSTARVSVVSCGQVREGGGCCASHARHLQLSLVRVLELIAKVLDLHLRWDRHGW